MQALVSVASRFLETLPEVDSDTRENIAYHMAFAHEEVAGASLRCACWPVEATQSSFGQHQYWWL